MSQMHGWEPHDGRNAAAPDSDPRTHLIIGVHVMTEFIFCPRAGLNALQSQQDDSGEDPVPRLDYLADYHSIGVLEEELAKTWSRIWGFLTWASLGMLGLVVVGTLVDGKLAGLVALASLYFVRWLREQFRIVAELASRLQAARQARGQEPVPDLAEVQRVNWWSLLKAGFAPVRYQDVLRDPALGVAGKPWRVLQKGAMRIPVFRKRCGEPELYPQHFARMAAYCHLITTCEGAESPYGVVLFGDGYTGVSVPNTGQNRRAFLDGLHAARRLVETVMTHRDLEPAAPRQLSCCRGCTWGHPRVHEEGQCETRLNNGTIALLLTRGTDKKLYHSTCGDRFNWVPPHELAQIKGLRDSG